MPYTVSVSVYNSAGELVKNVSTGTSAFSPGALSTSLMAATASGAVPVQLTLLGGGSSSSLVWDTTNNNGQLVTGGTYYIKVQTTDNFGKITAFTQAVTVIGGAGTDSLVVFNSAGEVVQQINLGTVSAPPQDFSVVGSAAGISGLGTAASIKFKVTAPSGATSPVSWNGENSQGQPVQSGTYMVRLVYTELGQSAVVKVIPVTILALPGGSPQASLAAAIAAPQPLVQRKDGTELSVVYPPLPGDALQANLYNLAGELVAKGLDSAGSGLCLVSTGHIASGIYELELLMVDNDALLARRVLKVVIIK
jgi:hypothetical protein